MTVTAVKAPPRVITKLDDVRRLVECVYANPDKAYTFDYETLGLNVKRLKVAGLGIAWGPEDDQASYIVTLHDKHPYVDHEKVLEVLKPMFEDPSLTMVAHNYLFDATILAANGVDLHTNTYDTMVLAWLLDTSRPQSLKSLVREEFMYEMNELSQFAQKIAVDWDSEKVFALHQVDMQTLSDYGLDDVTWTYRLWMNLLDDVRQDPKLDKVYHELYQEFLNILVYMQVDGIAVDTALLDDMAANAEAEIRRLELEMWRIRPGEDFSAEEWDVHRWTEADIDVYRKKIGPLQDKWKDREGLRPKLYAHPQLAHKVFSPNSQGQLNKVLFQELRLRPIGDKGGNGLYSVSADNLVKLARQDRSGFVQALMKYKTLAKLHGTYLTGLPPLVDADGRLRTHFRATLQTGRLSSSDPNLQNIVNSKEFPVRKAFKASEGKKLLVADYSQIELRLVAHFSGDQGMIEDFKNGVDPHSSTAKTIFQLDVPVEKIKDLPELKTKRQVGKAQPLDAKVLTPAGWRCMGDLQVGDLVIAADGRPAPVVGIYPQGCRDVYRVEFTDGSSTECDLEHLWTVRRNADTPWETLTLAELMGRGLTYHRADGREEAKYQVPLLEPVEFESLGDLPLDPYVFGVLLGNGAFSNHYVRLSSKDQFILDEVADRLPDGVTLEYTGQGCDYYLKGNGPPGRGKLNPVVEALRDLGLMGHRSEDKFVPEVYKRASVEDRLALLQGLMDTDGYVGPENHTLEFVTVSPRLAEDVADLVGSLGGVTRVEQKKTGHQLAYRVYPALGLPLFRLPRKAEAWSRHERPVERRIKSAVFVGSKPAQCIMIDHPDHLYVTDDYVVTHNTVNFATIYQAGSRTIADWVTKATDGEISPTLDEAQGWIDNFFSARPGVKKYIRSMERRAEQEGLVRTILGRPRHLPDARSNDMALKAAALRQAVNTPIQGSAADIIALAMRNIRRKLIELGWWRTKAWLLLQVHDELVFEADEDVVEELVPIVQHAMESVVRLAVPLEAEPSIADNWYDAK